MHIYIRWNHYYHRHATIRIYLIYEKVAQVTKQIYKGSHVVNEESNLCVVLSTSHIYLVDYTDYYNLVIKSDMGKND